MKQAGKWSGTLKYLNLSQTRFSKSVKHPASSIVLTSGWNTAMRATNHHRHPSHWWQHWCLSFNFEIIGSIIKQWNIPLYKLFGNQGANQIRFKTFSQHLIPQQNCQLPLASIFTCTYDLAETTRLTRNMRKASTKRAAVRSWNVHPLLDWSHFKDTRKILRPRFDSCCSCVAVL